MHLPWPHTEASLPSAILLVSAIGLSRYILKSHVALHSLHQIQHLIYQNEPQKADLQHELVHSSLWMEGKPSTQ